MKVFRFFWVALIVLILGTSTIAATRTGKGRGHKQHRHHQKYYTGHHRMHSVEIGYTEVTIASYYCKGFSGRKTANGERYNCEAMTAAHKTLPFHTRVRVTNLANGRSVVVRINDAGPYISGRGIDLSLAAAREIGMLHSGTAKVRVEVIK